MIETKFKFLSEEDIKGPDGNKEITFLKEIAYQLKRIADRVVKL